jgi:Two component regulator propeller
MLLKKFHITFSCVWCLLVSLLFLFGCNAKEQSKALVNTPGIDTSTTSLNYNQGKFFPNLAFEHFGVEDGLSSASISRIIQDKIGYLWIGTDNALNRYNGRIFKKWENDPTDTTSYPGGSIVDLAEAPNGDIWMLISGKGVAQFDVRSEKFKLFGDSAYRLNLIQHDHRSMMDSKGRYWYGHGYIDTKTLEIHRIKIEYEFLNTSEHEGRIFYVDPKKKQIFSFDEKQKEFHLAYTFEAQLSGGIRNVTINSEGTFLLPCKDYGVVLLNPVKKDSITFFPTGRRTSIIDSAHITLGGSIMDTHLSRKTGILWLAQWGGLTRIDLNQNSIPQVYRYLHEEHNPLSLPEDLVSSVFEDRSGVLWVGTLTGGLAKFASSKQKFTVFRSYAGDTSALSLTSGLITSVFEDTQERLWVGTQKGLNYVDLKTGKIKRYPVPRDAAYGVCHCLTPYFLW